MGFRAWVSLLLCHPSYKVSALALAGLVPLNTPAFHWSHGLSLVSGRPLFVGQAPQRFAVGCLRDGERAGVHVAGAVAGVLE